MEIKTDRKKYIAAHTHHANPDIGCLDHIWCFLFHFPPWFFPCCFHFFSSLLRVFFFLMDFYLLFTDRFSFWFFRAFLIFPSCEAQIFLLMFLVSPFDVLSILIGQIVFYRFVIGGALLRRSLSFPTSFAIHIFCVCIFTVIFSPIQAFFGTKIVTSSNWYVSTVGGALRRYRRGHGFKSRKGLNSFFFFQVLFSLLLM